MQFRDNIYVFSHLHHPSPRGLPMKTRMTELLGIQHPIMLAGMAFVSLPKLVAAVSNAGGVGMLNSVVYTPSQVKEVIKEIRSLTDKPFGVNATLVMPNARENIEVALEERVPIINFALGKGDWIIKAAHEYGGKVLATVALEKHARKAEADGADALIVTGHEAAAHGAEVGTMVLINTIARQTKLPIIAAGGFCDGRGLAAALVLGADGISMGTRFMLTKECAMHEKAKEFCLKAGMEDTLCSEKIDGLPGRWLKNEAAMKMALERPSLSQAFSTALEMRKKLKVPFYKLLLGGLKQRGVQELARQAIGLKKLRIAIEQGDLETGVLPVSQAIGLMRDVPTCKELIERIVREAEEVLRRVNQQVVS
ncbi:MAG: nitronate monooxygenase [Desulfobacterota bacterium]|nr:nitronate monooxygenase [Thermodesulfobacteriota bacterium]